MEQLTELPDFNEVYSLYNGRRPDSPEEDVPIEQIDVPDRKSLQASINSYAEEIYQRYREVSEDDPTGHTRVHEEEQMKKTNVLLGERVVDASMPLTMNVYKNFTEERGRKSESINFYFYKGVEDDQNFIGSISIADRGEEGLDIVDRMIEPKFRKQGFGEMFLSCAEAYIKKVSTERQEPVKAFTNTATQLTVIYWFWKNGYRPETEEDRRKLEMILAGHEELELAERYFVFQKSTPDRDRYFVKPDGEFALTEDGKRVINYNNAFRIKMIKMFEPEVGEEVVDIREEIVDRFGNV